MNFWWDGTGSGNRLGNQSGTVGYIALPAERSAGSATAGSAM